MVRGPSLPAGSRRGPREGLRLLLIEHDPHPFIRPPPPILDSPIAITMCTDPNPSPFRPAMGLHNSMCSPPRRKPCLFSPFFRPFQCEVCTVIVKRSHGERSAFDDGLRILPSPPSAGSSTIPLLPLNGRDEATAQSWDCEGVPDPDFFCPPPPSYHTLPPMSSTRSGQASSPYQSCPLGQHSLPVPEA